MTARTQACPNCGQSVTMEPYDIGSGPEMSCSNCEWCWGADGQPLERLDVDAIHADINAERKAQGLPEIPFHTGPTISLVDPED